jgi:hypothetical protein
MFDKDTLLKSLNLLPQEHCITFAVSCCERLVPNYHAFTVMEHWGDPVSLQGALDAIWAFLEGAKLEESQIHELIQSCEAAAPDSNDFESVFVGASINACAAIVSTLEYCLDKDTKHLESIVNLARDSIEEYLFIVNVPKIGLFAQDFTFDEWIRQAPLMVAEFEKQQQDLEALKECTILDSDFLADLRRSSSVVGIHPIKRGLVVVPDAEI